MDFCKHLIMELLPYMHMKDNIESSHIISRTNASGGSYIRRECFSLLAVSLILHSIVAFLALFSFNYYLFAHNTILSKALILGIEYNLQVSFGKG
jgi:hypothetical protein